MSGAIGGVAPVQSQQAQQLQQTGQVEYQPQAKPDFQPIDSAQGAKAISDEAFAKHMEFLNKILQANDTNVSMQYDNLSSPEKVAIVNDKGAVIREMPPHAAVEIAEKAKSYIIGIMVDKSV